MTLADDRRDITSLAPLERRVTIAIDAVLAVATRRHAGVARRAPLPLLPDAPVMSAFTAFSLLVMVLVRQARLHHKDWPVALSLAMTGLVLGGNVVVDRHDRDHAAERCG